MTSAYTPTARAFLTCLGLGNYKPFPGTWGSLPPVALAALLIALGLGPIDAPIVYNLVMLGVIALGVLACAHWGDAAEAHYHKPDPSPVVADEVAGMALVLLALPSIAMPAGGWTLPTLAAALAPVALAFVLFRIADITKPGPINRLQNAPGGWGIVADDLGAAALALVVLQTLYRTGIMG